MAIVSPFRALHYNTSKFSDVTDFITPPYDNIPPGDEKKYWNRSPYNFAHLDLPRSDHDDYQHSRTLLSQWREHSILVEDPTPGYYLYEQRFTALGQSHTRRTLMCTVGLAPFSEGVVRPHENTFGHHKEDRLRIQKATECNFSHIFGMVKDPEGTLATLYEKWVFEKPLLKGKTDEGVEHTVWRISAEKAPEVARFFSDKPIYIVDGHHRYESALKYATEKGVVGKWEAPAAHMLFAIANAYDPGLVVFPTHRIVRGVPAASLTLDQITSQFELSPMSLDALEDFVKKPTPLPTFGLWLAGALHRCTPKHWQKEEASLGASVARLAVAWSDWKLMKEHYGVNDETRPKMVTYEKDALAAYAKRDTASVIVFHAPPAIDHIAQIADEKRFMPQKSTFFYPKLAAGLTIRSLV